VLSDEDACALLRIEPRPSEIETALEEKPNTGVGNTVP